MREIRMLKVSGKFVFSFFMKNFFQAFKTWKPGESYWSI
jgi:hypothetical protein